MAIDRGYITLAEFKEYAFDSTTNSAEDALLEDIIQSTSRMIDKLCERTFGAQTETRLFDMPPRGRSLFLDDELFSLTAVYNGDNTTSGTAMSTGSMLLEPANDTPKNEIRLKQSATFTWESDTDGNTEQVVNVIGKWGYSLSSDAPDDIRSVTKELANVLYKGRKGKTLNSIATVTSGGVVLVPQGLSDLAKSTLKFRKRLVVDNNMYEGE